jgi:hypothetical protein
VPEVLLVAEHFGEPAHDLLLHLRGRRTTVKGVVVGVELHRGEVPDQCHGVRRLQHLPGVGRVAERVVVPKPLSELGERLEQVFVVHLKHRMIQGGGELGHPGLVGLASSQQPAVEIHAPSFHWSGAIAHRGRWA